MSRWSEFDFARGPMLSITCLVTIDCSSCSGARVAAPNPVL